MSDFQSDTSFLFAYAVFGILLMAYRYGSAGCHTDIRVGYINKQRGMNHRDSSTLLYYWQLSVSELFPVLSVDKCIVSGNHIVDDFFCSLHVMQLCRYLAELKFAG